MNAKSLPRQLWDFRRGMATARVLCQLGQDHGLSLDQLLLHTGLSRAQLEEPKGEIEALQKIQVNRKVIKKHQEVE